MLPEGYPFDPGHTWRLRGDWREHIPPSTSKEVRVKMVYVQQSACGVELAVAMEGVRNFITAQVQSQPRTVPELCTAAASCFHQVIHHGTVRDQVVLDTEYALPSEFHCGASPLPRYLGTYVAVVITWCFEWRLFGVRPGLKVRMLRAMKQGACTEGRPNVSPSESPNDFLSCFEVLAADRAVQGRMPVCDMVEIIQGGLDPSVRQFWDIRWSVCQEREKAVCANDHEMLFQFVRMMKPQLTHEWDSGSRAATERASRRSHAAAPAAAVTASDLVPLLPALISALTAAHSAPAPVAVISANKQRLETILSSQPGAAPAPAAEQRTSAPAPTAPAPGARPGRAPGETGQRQRRAFTGTCHNCGGAGHMSRDCPSPPNARANVTAGDGSSEEEEEETPAPACAAGTETGSDPEGDYLHVGCTVLAEEEEPDGVAAASRATYNAQALPVGFKHAAHTAAPPGDEHLGAPGALPGDSAPGVSGAPLHPAEEKPCILVVGEPRRQGLVAALLDTLQDRLGARPRVLFYDKFEDPDSLQDDALPTAEAGAHAAMGDGGVVAGPPGPAPRRSARIAAPLGVPIDPGDATHATVLAAGGVPASHAAALHQHAASVGKCLIFHDQSSPAAGVTLRFTSAGGGAEVMPPRVLDDSGAAVNLMDEDYARAIGAVTVPAARRICGSTGGSAPASAAVLADVVLAAGTPQELRIPQQEFLLVRNARLFDVLIGNPTSRFGPGETAFDRGRYYYSLPGGARVSLPMVFTTPGSTHAHAATTALEAEQWDTVPVLVAGQEPEPAAAGASPQQPAPAPRGGAHRPQPVNAPAATASPERTCADAFVAHMLPLLRMGGCAALILQYVLWFTLHAQWFNAGCAALVTLACWWWGAAVVRRAAPPLLLPPAVACMRVGWAMSATLHAAARCAWHAVGYVMRTPAARVTPLLVWAADWAAPAASWPVQPGEFTRWHVRARRRLQHAFSKIRRPKPPEAAKAAAGPRPRSRAAREPPAVRRGWTPRVRGLTVAVTALLALSLASGCMGAALGPAPTKMVDGNLSVSGVLGASHSWVGATTVLAFIPDGDTVPPPGSTYTADPEFGWLYGNHSDLSHAQQEALAQTVRGLRHCFAFQLSDLTGYSGPVGDFPIRLTHDKPIREGPRRYSPVEQQVLQKSVQEWVDAGFAEPCLVNGRYACNMVVAAKKNEAGEWAALRCCHNYRNLNRSTLR